MMAMSEISTSLNADTADMGASRWIENRSIH
jgi:hypothetical protein